MGSNVLSLISFVSGYTHNTQRDTDSSSLVRSLAFSLLSPLPFYLFREKAHTRTLSATLSFARVLSRSDPFNVQTHTQSLSRLFSRFLSCCLSHAHTRALSLSPSLPLSLALFLSSLSNTQERHNLDPEKAPLKSSFVRID